MVFGGSLYISLYTPNVCLFPFLLGIKPPNQFFGSHFLSFVPTHLCLCPLPIPCVPTDDVFMPTWFSLSLSLSLKIWNLQTIILIRIHHIGHDHRWYWFEVIYIHTYVCICICTNIYEYRPIINNMWFFFFLVIWVMLYTFTQFINLNVIFIGFEFTT